MSDTISIKELEATRAAMSGGDWEVDHDRNDQANIYARNQGDDFVTEWVAILPHQCVRSIEEQQERNADGICALHAAAPILLAIAKAALAHEAAINVFRESALRDNRPTFERFRLQMNLAHDVLAAALSKVRP